MQFCESLAHGYDNGPRREQGAGQLLTLRVGGPAGGTVASPWNVFGTTPCYGTRAGASLGFGKEIEPYADNDSRFYV